MVLVATLVDAAVEMEARAAEVDWVVLAVASFIIRSLLAQVAMPMLVIHITFIISNVLITLPT